MEDSYCNIKEIIEKSYVIGTYQRGYRWDQNNVQELLEDIYEGKLVENFDFKGEIYSNSTKAFIALEKLKEEKLGVEEYCLQPLVVKKKNEKYSVIDGQQRLTTIYIILKVLSDIDTDYTFPKKFSISYISRNELVDCLENILEKSNPTDIDSAYMIEAAKTARKWFLEKNKDFKRLLEDNKEKTEEKIESAFGIYLQDILLKETKFIWDEIEENSPNYNKSEQKIFADRNTGKLDLTDSELIKALFMNPEYYNKRKNEIKDRQILISEIWDIYENELHKEEFWDFLPISKEYKEKYEGNTRIDAIFTLLLTNKKIPIKISENNSLFKAIKEWIDEEIQKNDKSKDEVMEACWREICDIFDGIKELYNNNELYNLLSLYKMIQIDANEVYRIYQEVLQQEKKQRKTIIKNAIIHTLFWEEIEKTVKRIRYPDYSIRNILFAYNIAITNSSLPITRFDFKTFNVMKWDREHIYSTNEGYIENATRDEKIEILKIFSKKENNLYQNYLEYLYDTNIEEEAEHLELSIEEQEQEVKEKFWDEANQRYDKYFDFWRYLELKEKANELLKKNEVKKTLEEIVKSENFENRAEEFLQSNEYEKEEDEVFFLLKKEYLDWDKVAEKEFERIKQTKETTINWHGSIEKINMRNANFWEEYNVEKEEDYRNNIRRNYYRSLLNIIYDNQGIPTEYVTLTNHGKKKTKIVNKENVAKIRTLFVGSIYRINEKIDEFFKRDEKIDSRELNLGLKSDYNTYATLINDNSMGNMMLLPLEINRATKYKNVNFSGKRKYIIEQEQTLFLPIGTANVLMGKFIDLETSTEQWLMNERKNYIEDIIEVMKKYYKEEKNNEK